MIEQAPYAVDQPAALADDAFGHRDYTEALLSIVTDEHPPATVGVFGRWGVGKSTIVAGLQDRLESAEAAFVYFDAWRYEGDSLRRQFLIEAASQLRSTGRLRRKYSPKKQLGELDVDTQKVEDSLRFSSARLLRALLVGLGFALVALVLALAGAFDAVLSGQFGDRVLASVAAFTVGTFAGLFSQTVAISPVTTTKRTLQDPDRFAAKFAELLEALEPERLIVAIDNLDRCSPEKAVEMLGTIKTYLEPATSAGSRPSSSAAAVADKTVVFVVSVDDQALRRHLLTQEAERSRSDDDLAIHRYVDEYLAKFFSTRLPIRSIIPDDMRDYVAASLTPLIEARDLNGDERRQLVSFVATGLGRNPRRVKQFSNDLESRLRLLEERERKLDDRPAGIDPPVSGDVLAVAKLALIEFEWPAAFDLLVADPQLLERWEEEARSNEEVDWGGIQPEGQRDDRGASSGEDGRPRRGRQAFAEFLRQAQRVESPHVRAILRLKQSAKEVYLPGFTEFRAAAVDGERSAIEEILTESDHDPARLAACLPDILREEIEAGYTENARAVVDVVVWVAALQPFDNIRREILLEAAERPGMRPQLALLDPKAVLANTDLLPPFAQRHLLSPFVSRLLDTNLSDERRSLVADGLAPFGSRLGASDAERIRRALAGGMVGEFGIYCELVQAAPSLIPPGTAVAETALETITGQIDGQPATGESEPSLTARPKALAVARIALVEAQDAGLQGRAVEHVVTVFNAHSGTDQLAIDIGAARELLTDFDAVSHSDWLSLFNKIVDFWHAQSLKAQALLIQFVSDLLPRLEPPERERVARKIAAKSFSRPETALRLLDQLGERIPKSFKGPFTQMLVRVAAEPEHTAAALQSLRSVATAEEAPTWLTAGVGDLIRDGRYDGVLAVLDALRAEDDVTLRKPLAAAALDAFLEHDQIEAPQIPMLAAACRNVDVLGPRHQLRFADKLANWLHERPGLAQTLAGNLADVKGLAAEPALALVDALEAAARANGDPGTRSQLSVAADVLRSYT